MSNKIIQNSFKEYQEIDAYNQSMMKDLVINPRRLDMQKDKTGSLKLGVAFHSFVLEPESFEEEYAILSGDKRTKEYKEAAKELTDKIALSSKEFALMEEMLVGLKRQPYAYKLLKQCKEVESTLIWTDPDFGVPCKARIDALDRDSKTVFDLKTTLDAWDFKYSTLKFGYDFQAAFYFDGFKAVGIDIDKFYFVVCEKGQTNDCLVYETSEEFLDKGRKKYKKAFETILGMKRKAYPEEPITLW